jgi:ABC-2 type transport system permease protein
MGTYEDAVAFLLDESESPLFDGLEEVLRGTGMEIHVIAANELAATRDRLQDFDNAAVVHITEQDDGGLLANIVTHNLMSMGRFPIGAVEEILNYVIRWNQFHMAGHDIEIAETILRSSVDVMGTQVQDIANMVIAMALMMLMFMTVYAYGSAVAMSVATEKSTRVMETLIVSAKPSRILVGKCVGMGAVGLAQLVGVLMLGGILGAVSSGGDMMDMAASGDVVMPEITLAIAGLLVLYFLMGYALFAMINSMCGAMVSKMEDLNSALMPAALIAMGSFYVGGYVPMFGGGDVSDMVMLIPFTAPFAAPTVLLSGDIDWRLIGMSVLFTMLGIVVLSWISGKVYSASVLHYGSRLKFKDLRRLIKGNK